MRLSIAILLFAVVVSEACTRNTEKEGLSHKESVKLEQYMVEGQQFYEQYCSNCHQVDGKGLARLFPPLEGSDFLAENFNKSICAMKYGLQGEIIVNGAAFDREMPGVPTLTDLEIAEISTYIYNKWGGKKGIVTIAMVKKALATCQD